MLLFTKIVHVLAVGLWFGTTIFFTFVVGLSLFHTFWTLSDSDPRPGWFPLAHLYDTDPATWTGSRETPVFKDTKELRREQGSRVAGAAVEPLFQWYMLIRIVCAMLAMVTALSWFILKTSGRTLRLVRVVVLGTAFMSMAWGAYLEQQVHFLRETRDRTTDAVLFQAPNVSADTMTAAATARENFARLHFYSLMASFLTVLLVTIAMGLAACLPTASDNPERS